MLTIDYILVILSQVCKFSDSLLYGVFMVFSLFFSIFLLFSRFFTYFVNLTEIEKILLRVSSIFPVPVRSKLPDYSNRCIFVKIQALHYSLYPYVNRKSITLPKRKEQRSWQLYRRPLLSVSVYQCTLHNPHRAVLPR